MGKLHTSLTSDQLYTFFFFFYLLLFATLFQSLNNGMSSIPMTKREAFFKTSRNMTKLLLLTLFQIVLGEKQLWHMDRDKAVIWSYSISSCAQEPLRGDTCGRAGQIFDCQSSQCRTFFHLCRPV